MSSCCLPKMWNFSKVSIHQCFPFTSISFIFQYIVKILDLQPHLVWTFCHWILPVNFLDLNMSSEKHWVHCRILPPTQIQQCQSPRLIQGATVACEASVSRLDREHCRPSTAPRFSPGMLPKRPPIPAAVIFSLFWVLRSCPSRKLSCRKKDSLTGLFWNFNCTQLLLDSDGFVL